jgi:hypothetical protein
MISSAAWQRHKKKNRLAHEELVRSLQQENRQLRQELEDAHYRIRELEVEASQHSRSLTLVTIPTACSYDESDNFSVEVQSIPSVPSVTSSTTTAQMGSGAVKQKLQQQQKQQQQQQQQHQQHRQHQQHQQQHQQQEQERDDKEALQRDATFYDKNQPSRKKLRQPFSKLTTVSRPVHRIPEIRRLFSSTSDLSSSSAGSIPAVYSSSSTSSNDMINRTRSNNAVSTYAKKYLLRADSTDSDHSTESYLLGEV